MNEQREEKDPLKAIAERLPNGFHDAKLYELTLDLTSGDLRVIVGPDMSDAVAVQEGAEWVPVYPRSCLRFISLVFLTIGPIVLQEMLDKYDYVRMDVGRLDVEQATALYPGELKGVQTYWLFLHELNVRVRLGARGVEFRWLDEEGRMGAEVR